MTRVQNSNHADSENGIIDMKGVPMKKHPNIRGFIAKHPKMRPEQIAKATGYSASHANRLRREMGLPPFKNSAFSQALKTEGFDQDNWSHGWLKTDQASIFIRNEDGFLSYDDIQAALVAELKAHAPKYPKLKRKKVTDGHLLVIDPADVHIGKLSLLAETSEEYNIEIAKQRCFDGVKGLLDKAQGFPVEKILLIIGNDIIHIDNPKRTTTSGTPQDTDKQWWTMFIEAKDLYVRLIEQLIPIADVEVVFCPSNHDFATGFMLADTLSSWFHNCKHVSFQADIVHRKYIEYGLNMLAFDHGDGCKEAQAKDLMADEQPEMWGRTRFRYAYKHHVHHMKRVRYPDGEDFIGVTVEYLRSPSSADSWHAKNGYRAPKAVGAFIHRPTQGQVCRLTHYFL